MVGLEIVPAGKDRVFELTCIFTHDWSEQQTSCYCECFLSFIWAFPPFTKMMGSTRSSGTSRPRHSPSKWGLARRPWRSTLWVTVHCVWYLPVGWCLICFCQLTWPSLNCLHHWWHRSTSTSASCVAAATRKTGSCCAMAVTTATTLSVWSRRYRMCPRATGAAQNVLLR